LIRPRRLQRRFIGTAYGDAIQAHRRIPMKITLGLLALALTASAAQAGTWGATRRLEGPFAVSSPPEAPRVVMNRQGQGLLAWNATGRVRYADKQPGQLWSRSATVPGGGTGAGPVAAAMGPNGLAAIAWTTVATRYEPSKLLVSLRKPGGGFGAATEVAPGTGVWQLEVGAACDGSVTLLWADAQGVVSARKDGSGDAGACDGAPAPSSWSAPQMLSAAQVGARLPSLAVSDAGAVLAAWQQGNSILAARRPAGGVWGQAQVVSEPTPFQTWNAKAVLDGQDRAAVGFLDGNRMFVARADTAGAWQPPVPVSGGQPTVYDPALGSNAAGDLVAAWQVRDASNFGSIWHSSSTADGAWSAPTRLSGAAEDAVWPSIAVAADGSVALVAWVDQNTNKARAAVRSAGAWTRGTLGAGWWGGTVPVAAGAGTGLAGWAVPAPGNPNSATLVARTWQ
jgi:hypothetical protein